MDRPEKVITLDEVDERIIEHIRQTLANAVAKSLTAKAIKEVCGEEIKFDT